MPEQIDIPDIGKVTFKRHHASKSIRLKVVPLKGIQVTLPLRAKINDGVEFVLSNKKWLQKHLSVAEKIEEEKHFLSEGKISKTFSLKLKACDTNKISFHQTGRNITIAHPPHLSVEDKQIQQAIRYCSENAYKYEAKEYLPKRTRELAQQFGFKHAKIGITSAKTRWGSCSGHNNINFSFFLMTLPDHLIDYVILHELAHTVHKDHSHNFWALLAKACPDYKKHNAELKKHRTEVS